MAFDLDGARQAGYADGEIADYLGGLSGFDTVSARKSGYSDAELVGHLYGSQVPSTQGMSPLATMPRLSSVGISDVPAGLPSTGPGVPNPHGAGADITAPITENTPLVPIGQGVRYLTGPQPGPVGNYLAGAGDVLGGLTSVGNLRLMAGLGAVAGPLAALAGAPVGAVAPYVRTAAQVIPKLVSGYFAGSMAAGAGQTLADTSQPLASRLGSASMMGLGALGAAAHATAPLTPRLAVTPLTAPDLIASLQPEPVAPGVVTPVDNFLARARATAPIAPESPAAPRLAAPAEAPPRLGTGLGGEDLLKGQSEPFKLAGESAPPQVESAPQTEEEIRRERLREAANNPNQSQLFTPRQPIARGSHGEIYAAAKAGDEPGVVPSPPAPPGKPWLDPEGLPGKLAAGSSEILDGTRRVFGLGGGELGRLGELRVRQMREENAIYADRLDHNLGKLEAQIDRLPVARQYAITDAMERGLPAADLKPADQQALRAAVDAATARLAAAEHLDPEHVKQDYLGRRYKDPEKVRAWLADQTAKRPMRGDRGYLMKRSFEFVDEARAAGFEPVSPNPVTMAIDRLRSIQKLLASEQMIQQLRDDGQGKFKYVFSEMPDGYAALNDPITKRYGNPNQTMTEHVDKAVYEGLEQVAGNLGITHERKAGLRGQSLGLSYTGANRIETEFGSETSVLAHEIGHQLDDKYGLWQKITGGESPSARSPVQNELRALADLSWKGSEPSENYKRYVRKTPEKMAHMLEAYIHAPEDFRAVAPTVFDRFDKFVRGTPELKELADIRPGIALKKLSTEFAGNGKLEYGEWVFPKEIAEKINNQLAPGLQQYAAFRGLRNVSNIMLQLRLFGAFHLGFGAYEAPMNQATSAMADLGNLEVGNALKDLARVPGEAFGVATALRGSRLKAELLQPGTHPELSQLAEWARFGGARTGMDPFYRTALTKNMLGAFRGAAAAAQGGELGRGAARLAGGLGRAPFAGLEQTMRPMFEMYVPNLKLGAFARAAVSEVGRLQQRLGREPTELELRDTLAKVQDNVDDRFGQMIRDNMFWDKTALDAATGVTQSLGWNVGTARQLGGGVLDAGRSVKDLATGKGWQMSQRTAYALTLPLMTAIVGGVIHRVLTGRAPQTWNDLTHPSTGEKDENGNEIRLVQPTYWKDVEHFTQSPGNTVLSKVHPIFGEAYRMAVSNQDYYHREIRHPGDPVLAQVGQEARYAAKTFLPYSASNIQRLREEGGSTRTAALSLVGMNPAPASFQQTRAQAASGAALQGQRSVEARTTAEWDRGQAEKKLRIAVQQRSPQLGAVYQQATTTGKLDPRLAARTMAEAQLPPLVSQIKRIERPEEAIQVWRLATPAERAVILPHMAEKILRSQTITPDQQTQWIQEIYRPAPRLSRAATQ